MVEIGSHYFTGEALLVTYSLLDTNGSPQEGKIGVCCIILCQAWFCTNSW